MKYSHLFLCLALIALLIWLSWSFADDGVATYGGLPWFGWISIGLTPFVVVVVVLLRDSAGVFGFFQFRRPAGVDLKLIRTLDRTELEELGLTKYRGPEYPHPVIFSDRCISCQACVDACPHDVLAIVDGKAAVVAPDLCMEDTACQAECPVNPKACIVVNTTRQVRSLPAPVRDGSTYQSNVKGCYIIGDVSGVPLIKNAVKEGGEVIGHIARELKSAPPEPMPPLDVAIIGIGPGGASAAATAHDMKLRYVAIEQDKTLAAIRMYPQGKYIYFKPDTNDWLGGIPILGLGLSESGDAIENTAETEAIIACLDGAVDAIARQQATNLHNELIGQVPAAVRAEISSQLTETIENQMKRQIAGFLKSKGTANWPQLYMHHFVPKQDQLLLLFRSSVSDYLRGRIAGDEREKILAVWLGSLADKGVRINENETCKAIRRADDGDYFVIETLRGIERVPQTYTARRVVIAVGLRGAPNKLRLPNEDLQATIDGRQRPKVLYALTDPSEFRGRSIAVVGGGNSAVEAAIDLAAKRLGATVVRRRPEDRNQVTLLVRDYLATTLKLGNKYLLYKCVDEGLLDLRIGVAIKEIREHELDLEDVQTNQTAGTLPNDFIFALIGGERPDRFLESIGIEIV